MAKMLVAVIVVAGLWVLLQWAIRRARSFSAQRAEHKQQQWALLEPADAGDYPAVSLVPGVQACAAAQELSDLRMLAAQAPELPLAQCTTVAECSCRYQSFDDRRQQSRRAQARREHQILLGALGSERRETQDRRDSEVDQ